MSLPKVLILNQPFNNYTGGGITISNFFRGWDKEKLAVVCYHYLLQDVDMEICDTYYQLGHKEFKYAFPFNLLKKKQYSGDLKKNVKKRQSKSSSTQSLREKLVVRFFLPLLKYIGIENSISKIRLSPELLVWIREYSPDVIYAQATNVQGVAFIRDVHAFLKKPLIFHMMDDWPNIRSKRGLLRNREFLRNDYEFRKLLETATTLMGISDGMALEYGKRYNKDFITFHNPIDVSFWKSCQKQKLKLNDSPAIFYAGRVGLGIDTSLELVAKAIEQLNAKHSLSAKFVLQTKQKQAWYSSYKCVEHKDFVPYNELPNVFSSADILLLPYDFSKRSVEFIGFSMPTKAPEYMISGTPILLFAPKNVAIVKYANQYEWAKVVTDNSAERLAQDILGLLLDENARIKYSRNAIKLAEENHSFDKVNGRFRNIVCSAAEGCYN